MLPVRVKVRSAVSVALPIFAVASVATIETLEAVLAPVGSKAGSWVVVTDVVVVLGAGGGVVAITSALLVAPAFQNTPCDALW